MDYYKNIIYSICIMSINYEDKTITFNWSNTIEIINSPLLFTKPMLTYLRSMDLIIVNWDTMVPRTKDYIIKLKSLVHDTKCVLGSVTQKSHIRAKYPLKLVETDIIHINNNRILIDYDVNNYKPCIAVTDFYLGHLLKNAPIETFDNMHFIEPFIISKKKTEICSKCYDYCRYYFHINKRYICKKCVTYITPFEYSAYKNCNYKNWKLDFESHENQINDPDYGTEFTDFCMSFDDRKLYCDKIKSICDNYYSLDSFSTSAKNWGSK